MNPVDNLNDYLQNISDVSSEVLHNADRIFIEQAATISKDVLPDSFISVGRSISTLPDLEEICKALFSVEQRASPSAITWLSFWKLVVESLPKILPAFPEKTYKHLSNSIDNLLKQTSTEHTSASLHSQIKQLTQGESFLFLLPHGANLENLVLYHKNKNETYNITLFHAERGIWQRQGGAYSLQEEEAYPFQHFANIPSQEIFGPNLKSTIHAEKLLGAMQNDPQAILAVFDPFRSYQEGLDSPLGRMTHIHGHPLKGLNAFLYSSICMTQTEEALPLYKTLITLSRLFLSLGLFYSFENSEAKPAFEKLHSRMGLLLEVISATAIYLKKQVSNPYLGTLFEPASSTLTNFKEKVESWRYQGKSIEDSSSLFYYPEKSVKLAATSLQQCSNFFKTAIQHDPDGLKIEKPFVWNLAQWTAPQNSDALFTYLMEFESQIPSFKEKYPSMIIPMLALLIGRLPLPTEKIYSTLTDQQKIEALRVLHKLSHDLAAFTFQENLRFSLAAQNSAARLMLIAHALAESLDSQAVLKSFVPALKGYRNLTNTPHFYVGSYAEWQERQILLNYCNALAENRREIWSFDPHTPFSESSELQLTSALLDSYPQWKKNLPLVSMPKGKVLLLALLGIKSSVSLKNVLPNEDNFAQALSALTKIAMHTLMQSDPQAHLQKGYEETLNRVGNWGFDLPYAVRSDYPSDFFEHLRQKFDPQLMRNLSPKSQYVQSQNSTLSRFLDLQEELYLPFEEAASQSDLTASNLLSRLKSHTHFKNREMHLLLDRYLFRVRLAEGQEALPMLVELEKNPQVFAELVVDLFSSVSMGVELDWLLLRLNEIDSDPVRKSLKPLIAQRRLTWQASLEQAEPAIQIPLLLLLLRSSQFSFNWEQYFTWGQKLELLESQSNLLTPEQILWWSTFKLKMAEQFQLQNQGKPPLNLFTLSAVNGEQQSIPAEILLLPEFKRLFGNRVRYWRVDGEYRHFHDPLTGSYIYNSSQPFPGYLWRTVDRQKYLYLTYEAAASRLHIPRLLAHEGIWWYNPTTKEILAFYLQDPSKLWIQSDPQGQLIFQHGPQRSLGIERTTKLETALEAQCGIFGMHYYSFRPNLINNLLKMGASRDQLPECKRDLLTFPCLRLNDGAPLVFKKKNDKFVQVGFEHKVLSNKTFFYTNYNSRGHYQSKKVGTPIQLFGLLIEHQVKTIVRIQGPEQQYKQSIILPLQRFTSSAHSSLVYPLARKVYADAGSIFNSLAMIELPIEEGTFNPKAPLESLFAAYISLIGKDYPAALQFLNQIRPHFRFEDKSRAVLHWIIDSQNEAHDHSSAAAAVRLRAYKLLIKQGLPLIGKLSDDELPANSLETVYLAYLSHCSTLPPLLQISPQFAHWIMAEGFKISPPAKENQERWKIDLALAPKLRQVEQRRLPSPVTAKPLLSVWKEPVGESSLEFQVQESLLEGIIKPQMYAMDAGKTYPEGAFGAHYTALADPTQPIDIQWALIHQIEMTRIPAKFKTALKIAFRDRKAAPALPNLTSVSLYQRYKLVENWLTQFQLPAEVDGIEKIIQDRPQSVQSTPTDEEQYLSEIEKLVQKRADLSHLKILEKLADAFVPPPTTTTIKFTPSPFRKSWHGISAATIEAYNAEWEIGLKALASKPYYPLPDGKTIIEFKNRYQIRYTFLQTKDTLLEIKRQLNRIPYQMQGHVQGLLDETSGNKIQMHLSDALHMVHLKTDEAKLRYAQKRNPFLNLKDIEILNSLVIDYLENSILIRMLDKITPKIDTLVERVNLSMDDAEWQQDPSSQEIWQEIAELLYTL